MPDGVYIEYMKESRPIDRILWLGSSSATHRDRFVFLQNMSGISGHRDPDDVIEFAEALIKLAKQVKASR